MHIWIYVAEEKHMMIKRLRHTVSIREGDAVVIEDGTTGSGSLLILEMLAKVLVLPGSIPELLLQE